MLMIVARKPINELKAELVSYSIFTFCKSLRPIPSLDLYVGQDSQGGGNRRRLCFGEVGSQEAKEMR